MSAIDEEQLPFARVGAREAAGRTSSRRHVVCASDKFRGTASARQLADAVRSAATRSDWSSASVPVSDGGEGFLEALAAVRERGRVTGPLGSPVDAEWGWTQDRTTAVVEVAQAAGLLVAGDKEHNDPVAATSRGVGEQVVAAVRAGARSVVVGCGGSATTDGGWGMVSAVLEAGGLPSGARLSAATDVRCRFMDAARVFGPQKGADDAAVAHLQKRLGDVADRYRSQLGVDVTASDGAGAAGGLAGGVLALGGTIVPGFALVARLTGLADAMAQADVVVTGEGRLDDTSLDGKVVGEVLRTAPPQVAVHVVVGAATPSAVAALNRLDRLVVLTQLEQRWGPHLARSATADLVGRAVEEHLRTAGPVMQQKQTPPHPIFDLLGPA